MIDWFAQLPSLPLDALLFYAFAAMVGVSAVGVVLSRNIVRMAICLLFTLLGVAGLYLLLSAEFLAVVQLVVYVGGTLILIIFGVMLTSSSPQARYQPRRGEVVLALALGVILLAALLAAVKQAPFAEQPLEGGAYPMARLGQLLLGDFLIPFELASVLLLAVMIGAAYLAKARKKD